MAARRMVLAWDEGSDKPPYWIWEGELQPEPATPPPSNVVFHVDFRKETSVEGLIDDGYKDGSAIFASPFSKWRPNPAVIAGNRDVVDKRFRPGWTISLREDGLVLRAFPEGTVGTGYIGASIQTRQAMVEVGHRVDLEYSVPNCPPGIHMTPGWLMPADGSTDAEIDLREIVGNNHVHLDGPIDQFVNAKSKVHGSHGLFLKGTATKHAEWSIASVLRLPDATVFLTNGVEVHRAPNVYRKPMSFLATIEGGGNGGPNNDEFPGKFRVNSRWPAELILGRIAVTRI